MHSKIIQPLIHGKGVYENKGSSGLLIRYLQHEAKEKGVALTFFSGEGDGISPSEVRRQIDENIKGLQRQESKFISLVLSPGKEELRHIDNDPEKLKEFTRLAMQQYAENFRLKGGKRVCGEDLLWFATLHQERTYKGREEEVRLGLHESGDLKAGYHMHVHVVVSKRDRAQQLTLSPFGNRERFDMGAWQRDNQWCFNSMFHYYPLDKAPACKVPGVQEVKRYRARITARVETINLYLDKAHKLKPERVLEVAEKRQWDRTFFFNLNRLEQKLKKEQYVRDPLHLLEHNRDRKPEQLRVDQSLATSLKQLAATGRGMGFTESLNLYEFTPRRRKRNTMSLK
ncbi:DUF5712 family protein [Cesiribacter sp. SM1]|uniref:DUF5712 family protein n=1 Tax=Cesiribacter sp. SM1 TaxID=2861196 RepID=UPI001CD4FE5B|nr:DUF5712 family protein [Cesiribacter sp. SM1]